MKAKALEEKQAAEAKAKAAVDSAERMQREAEAARASADREAQELRNKYCPCKQQLMPLLPCLADTFFWLLTAAAPVTTTTTD